MRSARNRLASTLSLIFIALPGLADETCLSPMIDLYWKNVFSTVPWRW